MTENAKRQGLDLLLRSYVDMRNNLRSDYEAADRATDAEKEGLQLAIRCYSRQIAILAMQIQDLDAQTTP